MQNNKRTLLITGTVVVCCIVMAIVDGFIQPNYAIKSAVKLLLFLLIPVLFSAYDKELNLKQVIKPNKKGLTTAFALCIPVYIIILIAYMLFKNIFDFSSVTKSLTANIGVSRHNFVFVAIYISFVNSLLEEFFFRGFAFLILKKFASVRFACIFSSAAFALYHIAMMSGWFSVGVFVITLAGLFVGAMVFNYLNLKSGNIYTSWFVHMFANFAINTVGFILFDII